MSKFIISIIIPTYKRNKKLNKLIKKITNQIPVKLKIEIIIIGNNNLSLNNKKLIKKNVYIKYFKIKINSNAIKRNKGIKIAKGKNLILIDDDCLPGKNFISDYLKLFKEINDNEILCGSVKYLKTKIKNENFTRYRQSRHFIIYDKNISRKQYLKPSNVVTMNMGMKNSRLLSKTKYFNEKFGGYGFEDFEFGYRLIKKGFKFIPSKPLIYHIDERNYKSYLNKIYFLSRFSVAYLKKINNKAWKETVYFKIENNFIVNIFSRIKIIYKFIETIEKLIEIIERNVFLYLPNLYRFGIFLSYCRGYYDRKGLKKNKKNDWYE